jgi:hypothetical protein
MLRVAPSGHEGLPNKNVKSCSSCQTKIFLRLNEVAMKFLHIYRSKPTEEVLKLAGILSEGNQASSFPLYEGEVDYTKLVEAIFSNDKVVSWW